MADNKQGASQALQMSELPRLRRDATPIVSCSLMMRKAFQENTRESPLKRVPFSSKIWVRSMAP